MKNFCIGLTLFITSATALACPDFSGSYKITATGQSYVDMATIVQTGCETLVSTDRYNGGRPTETTLKLDGIMRKEYMMMSSARFEGESLVMEFISWLPDPKDPSQISALKFSSSKGMISKDALGNLKIVSKGYSEDGKLVSIAEGVGIRQ